LLRAHDIIRALRCGIRFAVLAHDGGSGHAALPVRFSPAAGLM
jgi:hypothetical protein